MASIKFYIKRLKGKKVTSIFFMLNYGAYETVSGKKKYLPMKYYTSESVSSEFWDMKTGRAKETKKFPQYPEFNARLQDIENKALNILRRLQNDGITPTNDILKTEFDKIFRDTKNNTEITQGMDIMQYIDHFINTSNCRESTKKSYRVVRRDLNEYQSQKRIKLKFDKIDIDFYNDFVKFLKSKNYALNTIGTRIKVLKTFLAGAKEVDLPVRDDYQKKSFSKPKEETTSIYLNESELESINGINLDKHPKLDRVRDLFLIGCYTGLRFSDLSQLNKNNVHNGIISIKTIKTDTTVNIPVHRIVQLILKKYDGNLPKVPSNQKFNEYIKEVAEKAGINEPITIAKTKGNLMVSKSEPKHNLVTSHTARRSFATNAYIRDIPAISIMMITGHKTEAAFMKYIKISSEDNAMKLKNHVFFSPLAIAE